MASGRMGPVTTTFEKTKAEVADKVRKLLTQAEDPAATPEEAQAFTMKAQQLMTKYSIELAMIAESSGAQELSATGWIIPGPYASHKVTLLNAVARSNDCRALYADLGGGRKRIELVGFASDIEWVQTLYRSLDVQLAAALAGGMRHRPPPAHPRTYAVGLLPARIPQVP